MILAGLTLAIQHNVNTINITCSGQLSQYTSPVTNYFTSTISMPLQYYNDASVTNTCNCTGFYVKRASIYLPYEVHT